MTRYVVYLEGSEAGPWMGHVPTLPGCTVRAEDRDQVVRLLPGAIAEHRAWLERHGEGLIAGPEPVELEVAGELVGSGPFNPGDTAALLPPDREPVTVEELEACFHLMEHARADLWALVACLANELLDWQPPGDSWTIRRVLRHVGNAEEWYVSRLVPPESLPPEWQDDEGLPILEFLEMERRTAVTRLRQLTAAERAAVLFPAVWTDHPEEAWTLRKAVRRFLEHEREHTDQVRSILVGRRDALLANLDAARQELLTAIADRAPGSAVPRCGDWTVQDVAGHLADWEWIGAEGLRHMAAAEAPRVEYVADIASWNRAHVEARRGEPWHKTAANLAAARQALRAAIEEVDPALLGCVFPFPWGGVGTACDWAEVYARHDREHALDVAGADPRR